VFVKLNKGHLSNFVVAWKTTSRAIQRVFCRNNSPKIKTHCRRVRTSRRRAGAIARRLLRSPAHDSRWLIRSLFTNEKKSCLLYLIIIWNFPLTTCGLMRNAFVHAEVFTDGFGPGKISFHRVAAELPQQFRTLINCQCFADGFRQRPGSVFVKFDTIGGGG